MLGGGRDTTIGDFGSTVLGELSGGLGCAGGVTVIVEFALGFGCSIATRASRLTPSIGGAATKGTVGVDVICALGGGPGGQAQPVDSAKTITALARLRCTTINSLLNAG